MKAYGLPHVLLIGLILATGCTMVPDSPEETPSLPTETSTVIPASTAVDSLSGKITFYSDRDGNIEIYAMDGDGSNVQRLTNNPAEDSSPHWSPDGEQIVFISTRDDPDPSACSRCLYQIYLIQGDGSDERRLIETEFSSLHPDWHPSGTKVSFDTEYNLDGDIYVVNSDGNDLTLLIEDGFWADWSPDGSQIVFASKRDGRMELYVADADGNNQQRLTDNERFEFFPAWSPDGQRIAYATVEQKRIFVIDTDGSDERQVIHEIDGENACWSPDGMHIAFQTSHDGDFEIFIVNVDEALQTGDDYSLLRLTDNLAGDLWPSWAAGNPDR